MLSADSPVFVSVIATRLVHVSAAQRCTRAASAARGPPRRTRLGAVAPAGAPSADARGATRPTVAAAAAPATMSWRREGITMLLAMGGAPICWGSELRADAG